MTSVNRDTAAGGPQLVKGNVSAPGGQFESGISKRNYCKVIGSSHNYPSQGFGSGNLPQMTYQSQQVNA
jgi:hypothetical protein